MENHNKKAPIIQTSTSEPTFQNYRNSPSGNVYIEKLKNVYANGRLKNVYVDGRTENLNRAETERRLQPPPLETLDEFAIPAMSNNINFGPINNSRNGRENSKNKKGMCFI